MATMSIFSDPVALSILGFLSGLGSFTRSPIHTHPLQQHPLHHHHIIMLYLSSCYYPTPLRLISHVFATRSCVCDLGRH